MFNKAHSAAYAVEAFQGAYLKTRYPIEFLAAVLSSRRGFYAPIFYVLEALRCGAQFLPPDVNLSEPRFLVRGDTIRLPLDQVKGLSQATLERIHAARPFRDAGDFYRRARPATRRVAVAAQGGRPGLAGRAARTVVLASLPAGSGKAARVAGCGMRRRRLQVAGRGASGANFAGNMSCWVSR